MVHLVNYQHGHYLHTATESWLDKMANQETTQVIMLAVLYAKQDFDYQLEAVRGPPCQVMLLCTCQLLGQCG